MGPGATNGRRKQRTLVLACHAGCGGLDAVPAGNDATTRAGKVLAQRKTLRGGRRFGPVRSAVEMDLVDAKVFVLLAGELNFSRAAQRLSYSVASVSNRIRRLEQELGVELFTRTSRRVELTPAGRQLLKDAQVVVHSVDLFFSHARDFAGRVQGGIVVAYSPSDATPALAFVRALRVLNKPNGADLMATYSSPEAVRAVQMGTAVAGICRMASPQLRSMPLAHAQPGALLVPIDHEFASRTAISAADLDGVPLVIWKRDMNPEHYDLLVGFLHAHGATPQLRERDIIGVASVADAVAIGDGVAFVSSNVQCVAGTKMIPMVGPVPPLNQSYLMWKADEHEAIVEMLVAAAATAHITTSVDASFIAMHSDLEVEPEPDPAARPGIESLRPPNS